MIVGPTAAGKTAVALALARLAPVEIVSADSRQVSRGLDSGTATPTASERSAVPHHGLDLVAPTERYSAGRVARDASRGIAGIRSRDRLPVVVGGTGFYLRALFDGLFEEPGLDPARREEVRASLTGMAPSELARWARRLDPGFRGGGRQRAARAVEVALLTGQPLTRLQRAPSATGPRLRPWFARLTMPRSARSARIATRAQAMLATGLVEEVRCLLAAGLPAGAPGLTGVGYSEAIAHLEGRLAAAELPGAIAAATRRYAKRQETWFRHQLNGPVHDFDATQDPAVLAQAILSGYRAALAGPHPKP